VPDVRYVCLSDLHFGAESSILTRLHPKKLEVDHTKRSPALDGLLDCLEYVTDRNESSQKPTLILAGDIFELALARDNDAAMVFEAFVKRALGPDGIFDRTVLYIPGNHDHHLWEGARERQYAQYVRNRSGRLEPPWHTTRMRPATPDPPVESDFVGSLIDRAFGEKSGITVRVVYPNLALDAPTPNRHVFIHHGQFVEAMYTIMSTAQDMIFPNQLPPPWTDTPVWDWEAENFAWIDFFWSTLGRSGEVGRDVGVVYASLQSLDALRPLNRNLARGLAGRMPPRRLRGMYAWALARGLDVIAKKGHRMERGRRDVVLSPEAQKGLQRYLESPLLHQIKREYKEYKERERVPGDVTFVFGHTHKPFEAVRQFAGYERPVCLYNTGGWVVDSTEPRPLHGGAAVVFDEDLNSASLRFFTQSSDPSSYRVAVAHCGDPNPLSTKLAAIVDPEVDPWKSFSRDAAELVEERHQALDRIITLVQGVAPSRRRRWRERGWGTR
jgi:UDP-2,3-diacylglucosamine pyrophosphatase LpxH